MAWVLAGLTGLIATAFIASGITSCSPSSEPDGGSQLESARTPRGENLTDVESWAFAIGDGALNGSAHAVRARLSIFDLVVIDGEEATQDQIAALRDGGTVVLGYLSVGTIEPWRSWYPTLEPFALDRWGDWGEYYADVNDSEYRTAILRIADALTDKGFDGLFLDNVDMVESHRSQEEGMRTLVSDLSDQVRSSGGLLFAQNGEDFALTLAPLLDGWNREDVTFGYDFDREQYVRVPDQDHEEALAALRSMRAAGLLITTTDYVGAGEWADQREAVRVAAGVGALPYVSDVELQRVPESPFGRSNE